jgi:integrase
MSSLPSMARKATGSVTRRPDGRWRARVTIGGKRRELALSETEAEAWELVAAAQLLAPRDAGPRSLLTWGPDFLDDRETDGHHRGVKKDRARWRARVSTAPFASMPLTAIHERDIRRWIDAMIRKGLKRPTVCNALNLLRVGLEAACIAGHLDRNPARGIQVPKMARTDDTWCVLDAAECTRLLTCEKIPIAARQFFTVALYTGARPGELYGLRWQDVRLGGEQPAITIRYNRDAATKTGYVRTVPLLPPALDALKAMPRGLGRVLVWPGDSGSPRKDGDDFGWAEYHAKAAGVDHARLYDLRHTCASALVSGRWGRVWSLIEVQAILGHRSIKTTERYAHFAPGNLHDAGREARAKWSTSGPTPK